MPTDEKTIQRFDDFCKVSTSGLIRDYKRIYIPVWECGENKLSEFECFFLRSIYDNPGITVNELKEYWGRTQGAVSQQLSALEVKGYIRKEKALEDKRCTRVYLTKDGERLTDEINGLKWKHAEDAVDELLQSGFTEDQIESFCKIYDKLEDISARNVKRLF